MVTLDEQSALTFYMGKMLIYFISVMEPVWFVLTPRKEITPFVAIPAQAFPNLWIAFNSLDLYWLLEGSSCIGADAMNKGLVVMETKCGQFGPLSRFADPTPSFTLLTMTSDPTRSV
jgi:hypothetical protein